MRRKRIISEINITPLVDVMLVLLIIFMVTTPLIMSEIPISLPQTKGVENMKKTDPIIISIAEDGRIYFKKEIMNGYQSLLTQIKKQNLQAETIYIKGDKNVKYGSMIECMNFLQQENYKVSLVTEDND